MTTKKLLWFSDSPLLDTGYATISLNITKRLAINHGWEIVYFSHNFTGRKMLKGEIKDMPFTLYGKGNHQFGADVIQNIIRQEQPSIFVTLLDTFMVHPWFAEQDFAPARTVFYFPVDGGGHPIAQNTDAVLRRCALSIAMSKHAQKAVKDKYGIDSAYIPHAVDSKHYVPFNTAKKESLRRDWGLTSKFVVGVVARNQPRKSLDMTIKSFSKFCRDKPDARLLLHMDPYDPAAATDLPAMIRDHGIENRVVWTGMNWYNGRPYKDMPDIYNLMDVFLLTTSGEGWGVPTTEAMSTEIPIVITDYTTTKEIVLDNDAGLPIHLAAEITGGGLVERAVIDIDHAVEQLNKLYTDPALRARLGKNGRKAVVRDYDWDAIAAQWNQVLTSLLRW